MKIKTVLLLSGLILVIVTVTCGSWAQEQQRTGTRRGNRMTSVGMTLAGPAADLRKFRTDFAAKEMKAASEDLRKGAKSVRTLAKEANEEGKKSLAAAADAMDKLAKDVEQGMAKATKKLDISVASVNYALAKHYYAKAAAALAKNDFKKAGEELRTGVANVREANRALGEPRQRGAQSPLRGANTLANELAQGADKTPEEVKKGMDDFGKELDTLGKKIDTAKNAAAEEKPAPASKTAPAEK